MRDRGVIAGAVVCALFGVVLLYTTAQAIQPETCKISSLEPGAYVACEGIVCQSRQRGKHCFVKIFDGAAVDVPFFNCTDEISVGDLLYVEGIVSVYNEELEIIPKKYKISKVSYRMCSDSELHTLKRFHRELGNNIHAVMKVEDNHTEYEQLLDLFVLVNGRISWCKKGERYTFHIFGSPCTFFSEYPITMGEVSGFGVQIGEDVIVLYYQWNELPLDTIAEAKQKPEGYPVKICGTIESIQRSEGHIFLVVTDPTGCILVPLFKDQQDILGVDTELIHKGQKITVTGIIKDYNGTREVLPEVIT